MYQNSSLTIRLASLYKFSVVPLNDNNPTRTTPYGVFVLIALNGLIFVYELSLQGMGEGVSCSSPSGYQQKKTER